jgi:hypothetical protein
MAFTQGLCQKLQTDLNTVAGINAPALKRDRVGYLDALMSEENRMGFEAIPIPTNGKYRAVQVNYIQRGIADSVNLTCTNSCDTDQEIAPLETIVNITNCIETKGMKFSEDQMRKLCEADAVYVSSVIMAQMNALNTALNQQLLAGQSSNFGKFGDGTTQKDIKLFEATTNAPRAIASAQIRHEFDLVGASGSPMIIGGGNFDLYAKTQQIACCNANTGTDLSRWTDYMYYNDRFVNTVIGANEFVVLAPGAVQLLTWNKYVGDYAKRNDVFEHGTITDPFTGLTYDLKVHYDDCADEWSIKLSLNWELFFLPENSFNEDDTNAGVNYTFHFADCSTIVGCEEA